MLVGGRVRIQVSLKANSLPSLPCLGVLRNPGKKSIPHDLGQALPHSFVSVNLFSQKAF